MPAFEQLAQSLRAIFIAAAVKRFSDAIGKKDHTVAWTEVNSSALKFLVMEQADRQSRSADRIHARRFHRERSQVTAIADLHFSEFASTSNHQRGVLGGQSAIREDSVGPFHQLRQ